MQKKYLIIPFFLYIILLIIFYQQTQSFALNQAELRIEEFLKNYKAIRTYISKYQKSIVFKLQEDAVIHKDFFMPNLLSSTFGARTINKIYNEARVKDDKQAITIKFSSKNPRNPLNKATPKELKLLDKYNNKTLSGKYKEIIKTKEGTYLNYILPTKLNQQKCMKCHSAPELAPKDLVDKYGNTNGFYEKVGDMRAILSTTMNIDDDLAFANRFFIYLFIITTLIFSIIIFIVNRFITKIEKEANITNLILNSQKNIVILTDGLHIKKVNKTFLSFFKYKSLDSFLKEHSCICDLFIEKKSSYSNSLLKDNENWIDFMLNLDNDKKIVTMYDQDNIESVFTVNFKAYGTKSHQFVITFTNITELNNLKNNLENIIELKTKELQNINNMLEQKIKEEVDKNREKDKQLFENIKMAQMGEMIGNIAHQWRQPLSFISTAASGVKLNYEFGILNEKDTLKYMDAIIEKTAFLSETINTFRDFIKEKKEIKEVILQERIDNTLNIVGTSLKDKHIKLKNFIDYDNPIKITMVVGELSQVIINIINNSKDILLEKEICDKSDPSSYHEDAWIEISLKRTDTTAIITIEDNGGGIPNEIISKIFDPYFTTKHQSQGTGLGLHMSYQIVVESLKGKLYVKNTDNGAKFFIELPLS
ncbi:MAG: DUF3365 domain-containing protein [Campylobacterota bacterium]|nr:DUF3365 domain-containing protein [Campylobacterota bacterium]